MSIMLRKLIQVLFLISILLGFTIAVSAQVTTEPENTVNVEKAESSESKEETSAEPTAVITEEYKSYSAVGKKGDLRLTSTISISSYPVIDKSQVSWRGVFDYYITDKLSFSGTSQIPFGDVIGFKPYFFALGGNFHYYKVSDFDFFVGGSSGFSVVSHPTLPTKAISTVDIETGVIWYGEIFHFIVEISYRRSEYSSGGFALDMNRLMYHFGMGFKI